jgi:8-oxo-dGTP pyrophosphatase MutT (NUDIX family)
MYELNIEFGASMHIISKRQANIKTIFKGKYLVVKLLDDWYEFLSDGTTRFVAVLGYRRVGKDAWEYLGRIEKCPPHQDGFALCALTGGIEKGEEPLQAALRELKEESGVVYDSYDSEIKELGTIRPSKMSDSTGWLFAIDLGKVPEKKRYEGEGDGSEGEKGAYCEWIGYREATNSKDPILACMVARLGFGCQ